MSQHTSIAQVRRFNRVVTQRVGAINDRYSPAERSLGASRVLWEIGAEGCEVRSLRSRLGLDSGQASRMLRALESRRADRARAEPTWTAGYGSRG